MTPKKKIATKAPKAATPKDIEQITNFVYEMGIHSKTPRSGFWFLGSGSQSVAEHLFRTALIAYALAHVTPGVNKDRAVLMALTHDLGEGRTGDLNYVHQRYGRLAEQHAIEDMASDTPFGKEILELFTEEQARETLEAKLVKDADQLEWIATLREEEMKGNSKATSWIKSAVKRLKTPAGKKVGAHLLKTHPDAWWFDEDDKWFVGRQEKHRQQKKK